MYSSVHLFYWNSCKPVSIKGIQQPSLSLSLERRLKRKSLSIRGHGGCWTCLDLPTNAVFVSQTAKVTQLGCVFYPNLKALLRCLGFVTVGMEHNRLANHGRSLYLHGACKHTLMFLRCLPNFSAISTVRQVCQVQTVNHHPAIAQLELRQGSTLLFGCIEWNLLLLWDRIATAAVKRNCRPTEVTTLQDTNTQEAAIMWKMC